MITERRQRGKNYTPEKKEQIRRMVASGCTNKEVADYFGMAYGTACKAVATYAAGVRKKRSQMPCNEDCEHCLFSDCIVPEYLF